MSFSDKNSSGGNSSGGNTPDGSNPDETPSEKTTSPEKESPPEKGGPPERGRSPEKEHSPAPRRPVTREPVTPEPVTPEEWRRLRAPFSREAYVVGSRATGRTAASLPLKAYSEGSEGSKSGGSKSGGSGPEDEGSDQNLNQAVVDLRLRPEAIRDRLDLVLRPGRYGYRLEPGPEAGGTFSMRCHLRIGPGRRTGVGTGRSLQMAGRVALASAAEAFGMGASGKIAGPIVAGSESFHRLPGPVLERLERREEPAPWTPSGRPLGEASQG